MPAVPWGKKITTLRPLLSRLLGERGPGTDVDAVLWVWLFVLWSSGRPVWKQSLAETASLGDFSVFLRKSEKLYFVYSSATFILCFLLFQPNWRINSLSSPSDIHRMEERKINEKENKKEGKKFTPGEEISVEGLVCFYADGYRQPEGPFYEQPQTWEVVWFREVQACLGLGATQSHDAIAKLSRLNLL